MAISGSEKHPVGNVSINYREWLIRAQMVQYPAVRGGDALPMRFFKSGTGMFEPAYLGDAYTFLKAINTGHGGSITTIHAGTAELAIERMAQTALEADGKMTYQDLIADVIRSIDVIVHVGKRDGKRGVLEVFLPSRCDSKQELVNEI